MGQWWHMPEALLSPELDDLLESPAIMENPYPIYARLRDEAPVCWSERWQSWIVSRYDDVDVSLREKEVLSNENRQALLFNKMAEQEREALAQLRHYYAQKDVIGSDPPDHTRMRALVTKAFTPRTVATLEPRMRVLAADMMREAKAKGRFDFVHEIAHPMPVIVIAELLGAPPKDRHLFKRWSAEILAFQGTGTTNFATASKSQESLLEMFRYMNDMIEARRVEPKDDLMTTMALAEERGQRFTRDELLATCNTMLSGGHETTTNLMGNLLHLLLANPSQWEDLKAEPALLDSAIEEALRYDAPKQRNFRRVKKDHVFQGVPFRENQMVFQIIGAANHDPAKFPEPDKFDIHRSPNDHLAFGAGIHFCLGAALARKEARLVMENLIDIMPDCRLANQTIKWQERVQFRGPGELWIECRG
jgi:hypothetical protein